MSGSGSGTPVSGTSSAGGLVTPPAFEPITLAELKLHLRIDSGSFADNVDEVRSILAGDHALGVGYALLGIPVEVLGYTVLVELAAGTFPAAGTAEVKIQESDTDGSVLTLTIADSVCVEGDGTYALIFTGTCVTAAVGTYTILSNVITTVSITSGGLGYTTAPTVATQTGDGSVTATIGTWTDWTGGAFTMVTAANDETTYEKAYTGTKRYIRTVAQVLLDTCDFGTSVIRLAATSVEDDLLNAIITAAREHVEDITSRQIVTATWDFVLQRWPDKNYIKLPYGNLQSVSWIKYKENDWASSADDVTLTLGTDYLVETNGIYCGRIVLPYGESWPSETLYPSNPITIRYVCGWTTAALVPSKIKSAVKLAAEDIYYHGDRHETLELVINNLLASYRLWDEF